MIDALNSWLKDHPLQEGLVFLVLSIVLTKVTLSALGTFWKFSKIPPQRLNIWILKARLSFAEAKLARFVKMRDDLKHLILSCFVVLLSVGIALVFGMVSCSEALSIQIHEATHQTGSVPFSKSLIALGCLIIAYLVLLLSLNLALEIINAAGLPNRTSK